MLRGTSLSLLLLRYPAAGHRTKFVPCFRIRQRFTSWRWFFWPRKANSAFHTLSGPLPKLTSDNPVIKKFKNPRQKGYSLRSSWIRSIEAGQHGEHQDKDPLSHKPDTTNNHCIQKCLLKTISFFVASQPCAKRAIWSWSEGTYGWFLPRLADFQAGEPYCTSKKSQPPLRRWKQSRILEEPSQKGNVKDRCIFLDVNVNCYVKHGTYTCMYQFSFAQFITYSKHSLAKHENDMFFGTGPFAMHCL